jgi:hypothetical protein
MSQGIRPGGLTALAVLNFVIGGFGCLGVLASAALLTAGDALTKGIEVADMPSDGMMMFSLAGSVVTTVLLIISGVGYLGMKKTLGYRVGNIYAVASILLSLAEVMMTGFVIYSIIIFVYPLVTLFLLNTAFKEDFVN